MKYPAKEAVSCIINISLDSHLNVKCDFSLISMLIVKLSNRRKLSHISYRSPVFFNYVSI